MEVHKCVMEKTMMFCRCPDLTMYIIGDTSMSSAGNMLSRSRPGLFGHDRMFPVRSLIPHPIDGLTLIENDGSEYSLTLI